MNKWKGKSKGTVAGYRIFVWCIRNIGIRSSYVVLYFVAAYYFLFQKKSNQYILYYFQKGSVTDIGKPGVLSLKATLPLERF